MPQIKIYSTDWCAYCKAEKRFLDEKGVKYQDVNVEADQAEAEAMVKVSGQMGVPVTVITRDDNTQAVIVGFDQPTLVRELQLG